MRYYVSVWLVLFSGWVVVNFVRISLSPILPLLIRDFGLSHGEAGLIGSFYFYGYAIAQVPAGYFGERFGKKRMLVAAALLWSLTSFSISVGNSYLELSAAWFFSGLSHGLYFGNDRPLVSHYTPNQKMGLGHGITFSGPPTGMAMGLIVAGWLANAIGWREVYQLLVIPPLVMSVVFALTIREPASDGKSHRKSSNYVMLLARKELWMIYASGITNLYALWVLGTWLPSILLDTGVKSLWLASDVSALIGIAGIPGGIVMGFLSDSARRRGVARGWIAAIMCLIFASSLVTLGLSLGVRLPFQLLIIVVGVAGFSAWGFWTPVFASLSDQVSGNLRGTAFGLLNAISFVGSVISPWVTGFIRDETGTFAWGLFIAAVVILFGAVLLAFETRYEPRSSGS